MGLFSSSNKQKHVSQDRYPGPAGKSNGADLIEGTRPCLWCRGYFRPSNSGERFCSADHAEKAAQS